MSSNHASLEAAATERKARLARLAALKRQQPEPEPLGEILPKEGEAADSARDVTTTYLSGRNYDPETRGPKLGFEKAPVEGQITLEEQASVVARETSEWLKEDEVADRPIDLFKLQPKKPNWDLKRHLDEKMKILSVRTDNAIAKLVRQRMESAQKLAKAETAQSNGEEVGIEGEALVEGIHAREQAGAEDVQREKEAEEEDII
jgi:coiled-coil domain-containing protein 12